MSFDDLLSNGQPYSSAGILIGTMKAFEDAEYPGAVLGIDADTVIPHREHPERAFLDSRDVDGRRFLPMELDGVPDQVLKHLREQTRVGDNFRQKSAGDLGMVVANGNFKICQSMIQKCPGGYRAETRHRGAGLGKAEQVADQALHPGGSVDGVTEEFVSF